MPDGFNGNDGQGGGETGNVTGGNPAWNDFFEAVPQEYRDEVTTAVTPVLQKWDQGVQGLVQKVHSEYEPYKLYKENGVTPDTINTALSVLNTLQENPEYLWKSLGEYHKFGSEPTNGQQSQLIPGQGQGEPEEQGYQDPRYDELSQQFQTLASVILSQQEQQTQAQADAELEAEFAELHKKHGDFDDDYVVSKMLNQNMSGEDAVKAFQDMTQRLAGSSRQPFSFLGANSGGVPGTNTDIRKASPQDARNVALQMLQAAAHERNQ